MVDEDDTDILSDFLTCKYQKDVKYETWVVKDVVSCDKCKGTGFVSREELTNYHKREYDTFVETCTKCKGDGRLTQKTEHLTIRANYPIPDLSTSRTTSVPYSEDSIKASWYSDVAWGFLKKRKRN